MAYGPAICACCGADDGIEEHHLYLRADSCPDDLTVWLCHACHGRAHAMRRRINIHVATKAALAAAKVRGAKLGLANPARIDRHEVSAKGVVAVAASADRHAANVLPIIRTIQAAGVVSLRSVADALNARGIHTARGGKWYAATVRNMLTRREAA